MTSSTATKNTEQSTTSASTVAPSLTTIASPSTEQSTTPATTISTTVQSTIATAIRHIVLPGMPHIISPETMAGTPITVSPSVEAGTLITVPPSAEVGTSITVLPSTEVTLITAPASTPEETSVETSDEIPEETPITVPPSTTAAAASSIASTINTAIIPTLNWVVNGDAETGPCETGEGDTPPTSWEYNGTITQIYYNTSASKQMSTDPGPSDRRNCFFYGQDSAMTSMWQTIHMTDLIDPSLIDNQIVWFNLSAWIGGCTTEDDNAEILMIFIDEFNLEMNNNNIELGPVLAADRDYITQLLFRQVTGLVPIGARSCKVIVTITRLVGTHADGDIDNIALFFYQ
ncbi:unnamed protein product [Adineta steineri]|uniref:Uncharacterized protein n=1 Tax=Adineta steineri TaxID=433720 RepID=A0A814DFL6_9BILA|nr:unnamed protein product [Adineta steineri]